VATVAVVARAWHIQAMSNTARARIDPALKREAEAILERVGLSPTMAIRTFYAQVVKVRGLPFRPSEFPVLEEYGATLPQAIAAEDAVIAEFTAARKAGKVRKFTGKL
jgi:addiction module RelB/DinJ family antitoxin